MTPKKRKLQLVPYEPDNYTPGDVLALGDATILKSDKTVGAALSLYFQWEKKRSCHITFPQETGAKALLCEMNYDRDESFPTEIQIRLRKIPENKIRTLVPGSSVFVFFEIFRVTYIFTSTITAVSSDPNIEGWHSIIDVPTELRVLKSRHLPRLELNEEQRRLMPKSSWRGTSDEKIAIDLRLLEIGMGSIRASFTGNLPESKTGLLLIGETSVPTEVVRILENEIILRLKFNGHEDFGQFFDYYRVVAYPSMRSRYEVSFEEGIELYNKSNYFSSFNAAKTAEQRNEIIATWKAIKSGAHKTNVDHYILDDENKPIGCSSLALTNLSKNQSVWTFHQTCALKKPEWLASSAILYMWRAEYLAARSEDLVVWERLDPKAVG